MTNPLTKTVLGQMFDDMLGQGRYFEDSQYVHLGADEVAMTWPNARALYTDFENTFLLGKMTTYKKTPIVWNDIISN